MESSIEIMKLQKRSQRETYRSRFMSDHWACNIILLILSLNSLNNAPAAHAKKSIPHSKEFLYATSPAWNSSHQIDKHGFLSKTYKIKAGTWESDARIGGKYGPKSLNTRKLDDYEVVIRQVPGDGNCLFHSLTTALSWAEDRVHLDFDESYRGVSSRSLKKKQRRYRSGSSSMVRCRDEDEELDLITRSTILRNICVDVLNPKSRASATRSKTNAEASSSNGMFRRRGRRKSKPLFLQGSEFLRPEELLDLACSQYGLSGDEYCESMKNNGVWGGGPEIVALCNYLRRPIHVYELMALRPQLSRRERSRIRKETDANNSKSNEDRQEESSKLEFRLRRMALFGSPKFDYREPLHILSADCRFPDIKPGQQASAGNHFMAMFIEKKDRKLKKPIRIGASSHTHNGVRVRSGGRDRRNESTFAKREVISKYLWADDSTCSDCPTHNNGIVEKLRSILKNENGASDEPIEGNNMSEENPFRAIYKWCADKRSLFPCREGGR